MTILRRGRAGRRPRGRGQTLVEFALVLPIFLVILMSLLDFGRVIYAQHTINQDAREGARVGAVSADGLSGAAFTTRYAAIRAAARVMAPAVPMTDASIAGDPARGCNNVELLTPPKVVVTIRVTVPLLTPIISNIVGGSISLSATSEQLLQ